MMSRYRFILCGLVLGLFPGLAVSQEACTKAGSQDHQVPNFRVAATCSVDEGKAVIIDTLLAQAESERKTKCPACKCQFAQPSVCTTAILDWQLLDARLQITPIRRSQCKSGVGWLVVLTGKGSNDRFRSACNCVPQ
ncbi:MAG TPA: hypothetical protein VK129_05850 [Terriglobales bacterium]|nr:hypothetical protein [Terriglobales bacterium]